MTHNNSLKEVQNIANSVDLIDIWRVFNPDAKRFTWRRKKPKIHCRLDFFPDRRRLSPAVTKADILAGYKTDRSLLTLHAANSNNPRSPGFWKLNTSFLSDSEQLNLVKKTIAEVTNEYKSNNEVAPSLLWDTTQMRICLSMLKYAKGKRSKMKSQKTNLECDILSLQNEIDENDLSKTDKTDILYVLEVKTL